MDADELTAALPLRTRAALPLPLLPRRPLRRGTLHSAKSASHPAGALADFAELLSGAAVAASGAGGGCGERSC